MMAYYERKEAPIDEITGIMLYAVYIRDPMFEKIHPTACTKRLLGVYDKEETAIAVTNAINEGII